jgi:carboxypeptidase PM20D1
MWFATSTSPCSGASPLFIKDSDRLAHGLNERIPVADVRPSMAYMLSLVTDLSK